MRGGNINPERWARNATASGAVVPPRRQRKRSALTDYAWLAMVSLGTLAIVATILFW